MEPFLSVANVSKSFGNLKANNEITVDFYCGEVHVVLGENGAGKSTLMNIIFGLLQPDEGEILIKGKSVKWQNPSDAIKAGIGMVHQHFKLVPNLTVAENIVMGSLDNQLINYKEINTEVGETCKKYGLNLDPESLIYDLSAGQKQQVEILKCLYQEAKLFILDEPTSVLTPQETRGLFETLRKLCNDGRAVIMITHKMDEVMEVSDKITVLKDGRKVGTVERAKASIDELSKMMVGKAISNVKKESSYVDKDAMLQVSNLYYKEKGSSRPSLDSISFNVHKGEIFGVVGVAGNGQKELVDSLSGLLKVDAGEAYLDGKDIINQPRSRILNMGLAHIDESRQACLAAELSVMDNSILGRQDNKPFSHSSGIRILNFKQIREYIQALINDYSIKTKCHSDPVKYLSGGHQQRLVLGREISKEPLLIIADKPTYGLDISADAYVRSKLVEICNEKKVAVLLVANELDMAFELCDRFMVMYCGRNMGIYKPEDISVEEVGLLMMGRSLDHKESMCSNDVRGGGVI